MRQLCWRDLKLIGVALTYEIDGAGGEISDVQFSGIDWGKNAVKRFCPPAAE
ncbi:MAG: hypothetical protein LBB47_01925 [Spirochaetaceae bacterium]|nr:hypothetical protein [Spirochaetaceae bacterium]